MNLKKFYFITAAVTGAVAILFLLLTGYCNSVTPVGEDFLDFMQGVYGAAFFLFACASVTTLILGCCTKPK